jgi:DNA modification methylase
VINLYQGDCLEVLKTFPDNSVEAVVTDPPYGLAFMNKKWDYDVPSTTIWKEVLRVLKPGGHLLSFGGTRTYHRMVVNIEDAGFEIRDQIQWLYGSGFPKSTNIAIRIDKESGAIGNRGKGFNTAGQGINLNQNKELRSDHPDYIPPAPATEAAKQWEGWGTALKPANEPIVLARKPLEKGLTVADNVLKWGVGGLNISASRIGTEVVEKGRLGRGECESEAFGTKLMGDAGGTAIGRFPANLLLDEQAAAVLDEQTAAIGDGASRFFYVAKASKSERNKGCEGMPEQSTYVREGANNPSPNRLNRSDNAVQNTHPTVKPVKLMEYLVKLITPPNGIVLDPFMGSGTTGVACKQLGVEFVGIEREEAYVAIAKKRTA